MLGQPMAEQVKSQGNPLYQERRHLDSQACTLTDISTKTGTQDQLSTKDRPVSQN